MSRISGRARRRSVFRWRSGRRLDTNASANSEPIFARSARYRVASSVRPMASAISAISTASCAQYAVARSSRGVSSSPWREPVVVAGSQAAGPQVVRVAALQEVHPGGHRRGNAVARFPGPRTSCTGSTERSPRHLPRPAPRPGHARSRGAMSVIGTGGQLRIGHIVQPLGEERRDVTVVAAVRAKIWASPSQPSRSSRCGQSVGTLMKFPRWPQSMLRTAC